MPPDASPTPAARVQKIRVQGVDIVFFDFSYATPSESLAMLDEYPRMVAGAGPNSLLVLNDLTKNVYDSSVSNKWKAARVDYDPYVRAGAVYGMEGLVGISVRAFTELAVWLGLPNAKQKVRVFADREKALEWLLKQ